MANQIQAFVSVKWCTK